MANWRNAAACLGMDTDLFFPIEVIGGPKGISGEKDRTEAAKKICAGCQVQADCLDYALENEEEYGVFGGTTPGERRNLLSHGRKCA